MSGDTTMDATEAQEAQTEQTTQESVTTEPQGQTGTPDWEKASEKYRNQRDEARTKVEELTKQINDLMAKGDIDAVRAELKAEQEKAEAAAKQAERDRVNTGRLAKAGCVDLDVALSLLDENGDVDALKEAKPYLFATVGSTGLPPAGKTEDDDLIERAMGLKPRKS